MASTKSLQSIVTTLRSYPDIAPILSAGGNSQEPALTIANDVLQMYLAQNLPWKFNRAYIPTFLTVALQQDYVTNVTDLSWLEYGQRLDINNSSVPKPFFSLETVRDISPTSYQSSPFNVSWLPNSLAAMGTWQANFAYQCGYGAAQTPSQPIQQFIDKNGNILFINSNSLGLSINSPGIGAAGFVAPTTPYGTSGGSKPFAATNATAGTTVVDGTVTWTVADPNGIAIRLAPLPALGGITWLMAPVYQKKPPILTSLQNTLAPIPDEFLYLFRQGFMAMAYVHAGSKNGPAAFAKWQEDLVVALRSGDREREDAVFYPSQSITGSGPWNAGQSIGPAWPFFYDGTW